MPALSPEESPPTPEETAPPLPRPPTSRLNLTPLLDPAAFTSIADQLWSARERLSLRTGGQLPSAPELLIALRLFTEDRDKARLQNRPRTPRASSSAPSARILVRYLTIADAAYADAVVTQDEKLHALQLEPPFARRLQAQTCAPGYFLTSDLSDRSLILAVRGSKEVSDFITNLTVDHEPFLQGHAHQGIAKSAKSLYENLYPILVQYIHDINPSGLVLVGHSLGGAVAAALTLLLRTQATVEQHPHQSSQVSRILHNASCFSYAPPPFLSQNVASLSATHNITTLVSNLDIVSRLSAASVDRLLFTLSSYDWSRSVSARMGEAAGTVASAFVSPPAAQQISDTVSRHGSAGLQHASSAVGHVAQLALNSSNQQRPTSFLWGAALNATVFASKIVSSHLENGRRRLDARHDYSFARQFDMDAERVETVLNEGPKELFLSGRVWHLCRRFTDPTGVTMARSRVVQADRDQFKDVEVSGWMVYDHHPYVMLQCLERMLCDD